MIKLKDIIEGRESWSAEDWSKYHNSLGTGKYPMHKPRGNKGKFKSNKTGLQNFKRLFKKYWKELTRDLE